MIQVESPLGSFIISDGLIVTRNPDIEKIFNVVSEEPIQVHEGDQDPILVERMITVIGGGSKIIAEAEEPVDPTIIY